MEQAEEVRITNPKVLDINSQTEYEALIETGWPILVMFIGHVESCQYNPILRPGFLKMGEEYFNRVQFVEMQMDSYDQPVRNFIRTCANFDTWKNDDHPKWEYYFISFYNKEMVCCGQYRELDQIRKMADSTYHKYENRITQYNNVKHPKEIFSFDWNIILNNAKKPILLHFRPRKENRSCHLSNPANFLMVLNREIQETVDIYEIEYNSDCTLGQNYEINSLPYLLAFNYDGSDFVVADRIPHGERVLDDTGIETPVFNYSQVYDLCVKLTREVDKNLTLAADIHEITWKNELEYILHETKKPCLIYVYEGKRNLDNDHQFLSDALKCFRKLRIQYRDQIVFVQVDHKIAIKNDFCLYSYDNKDRFIGYFNDALIGDVRMQEDTDIGCVEKLEELAKKMADLKYLDIPNILNFSRLNYDFKKPCILAFYNCLEDLSSRRLNVFNKLYKEFGPSNKVQFLKVEYSCSMKRYILTQKDLPQGCGREATKKIWIRHRDAGHTGDLFYGLKIYENYPSFIGYFNGQQIKETIYGNNYIKNNQIEAYLIELLNDLSAIKEITVPFVSEIENLQPHYDCGKPVLIFFHNDYDWKISNVIENLKESCENKVVLLVVNRGGEIYQDFDVLYNWPAFCATWKGDKIKKIENKNVDDNDFERYWTTNKEDVTQLIAKLKSINLIKIELADKNPVVPKEKEVIADEEEHKQPELTKEQINNKMRNLLIKNVNDSNLDESFVTHNGENKKLFAFKAVELNKYLHFARGVEDTIRLQLVEKDKADSFYIRSIPQDLVNFSNGRCHQIIYSEKYLDIHDKDNETRMFLNHDGNIYFHNLYFSLIRFVKNNDGYLIQNVGIENDLTLCSYYHQEQKITQVYGHQNGIKINWQLEVPDRDSDGKIPNTDSKKYNSSILDDL